MHVGREGFQPGPLFQEDRQMRWRANDPLRVYRIFSGNDFVFLLCSVSMILLLFYFIFQFQVLI